MLGVTQKLLSDANSQTAKQQDTPMQPQEPTKPVTIKKGKTDDRISINIRKVPPCTSSCFPEPRSLRQL